MFNTNDLRKKLHVLWNRHCLTVFTLVAVVGTSYAAMNHADALYILTGVEDSAIVLDDEADTTDLSSQLVFLSSNSTGYDVTLTAGQRARITYNGTVLTAETREETVSALLDRLEIHPSPLEMVAVDFSDDGVELTVASELTYYDRVTEPEVHKTIRRANPYLAKGTENVVQSGADGTRTSVYEVVWSGGEQVSRQFVEELDGTAVDEIVEVGTAVSSVSSTDRISKVVKNADGSGYLAFQSGATMPFSAAKSMTATAYTAGHGGADTCTATGTTVGVGTVAVDKSVIPLGTRMYIVTNDGSVVYGMAVASDRGVRGNTVDLYYNTYQQCINFGRRSCTVYLLP